MNLLALWHRLQGFLSLTISVNMTAEREVQIPIAFKADQVRISEILDFQALENKIKVTAVWF